MSVIIAMARWPVWLITRSERAVGLSHPLNYLHVGCHAKKGRAPWRTRRATSAQKGLSSATGLRLQEKTGAPKQART